MIVMDQFGKKEFRYYANFLSRLAKDMTKFYYLKLNKPFKANVGIGDSIIIGLVTKISIREQKEVDIENLNQQNEDNLKNELLFTLTEELQKELSSEVYPERLDFLFETINAQGSF